MQEHVVRTRTFEKAMPTTDKPVHVAGLQISFKVIISQVLQLL
jgi:hypothetical protein